MSYKDNETNKGQRWSTEEIDDLIRELNEKISIFDIATSHKRTEKAIELQGLNLAHKLVTSELKDITEIYGFSIQQINDYYEFKQKQDLERKEKQKLLKEKKKKEVIELSDEMSLSDYLNESDESYLNIQLNEEQQLAYDKVTTTDESIFLTGPPGTGKSHTLRKIIGYLKNNSKNVGITSTTGCSAILIGARTLHSYLKLSIKDKTPKQLFNGLSKFPEIKDKLINLDVLIIDEISMLSNRLFEIISNYLSLVRNDDRPFGGIQLILVGDFCQLPPVQDTFCFLSDEWTRLNPSVINLNTLVRQEGDTKFQELLERARMGLITDDDVTLLQECKKKEDIDYICLCSTNKQADTINTTELERLIQDGKDIFTYKTRTKDKLKLCIGCKVMVNWNIDIEKGIVNGTTGTVVNLDKNIVSIKISNSSRVYKVKYVNIKDENTGLILQTIMPLQLAWGITIHKSQGATIDYLLTDLGSSIFADGQAYVALSRVKNLDNLALIDVKKKSFKTNYNVKRFYEL
jgi:ATP-dependent DNA helicase PIF1